MCFAAPQLQHFNGSPITEMERSVATHQMSALRGIAGALNGAAPGAAGGSARQRLTDNDANTVALSRSTVDNAIAVAMRAEMCVRKFDDIWPIVIRELIREVIDQLEHLDEFMARCLQPYESNAR